MIKYARVQAKPWAKTKLGELLTIIRGVSYKKQDATKEPGSDRIPILRATNIQSGLVLEDFVYVPSRYVSEEQLLRPGDIVVAASSGSRSVVGKAAQLTVDWHGSFGTFCFGLRPKPGIHPRFLSWFLQTSEYRNQVSELSAGVNINNLKTAHIEEIPISVPDVDEQRRIVAEIEKQLTRLDAGVAALRRTQANLKRYRAAVLKAACEGRLVPTEAELARKEALFGGSILKQDFGPSSHGSNPPINRGSIPRRTRSVGSSPIIGVQPSGRVGEPAGSNPIAPATSDSGSIRGSSPSLSSNYETGEQLLARILIERRKNWCGKGKYKEATVIDHETLPPLPDGWTWASMRQVGEVQLGRQRAPQHHSGDNMRPYLRVANVFEARIDTSDVKEMNFTPIEFERYRLRLGDILLNEGQTPELVGRPAMFRDEIAKCCYQKTLLRFRAYEGVLQHFALIVFRSYMHNRRFTRAASITTNIAHLTAEKFVEIEFPLPSLAEQARIVAEVERRLSVVDELESVVKANLQRATRLRQSILQKAFAGGLSA